MKDRKNVAIDLLEKFSLIQECWTPKVVAEMNDYQFKLVRLQGEFVWHDHKDTDETFLVLKGEMQMHFRDRIEVVKEGELLVVEREVEHKPVVNGECLVLIIEPRGVVNTGSTEHHLTAKLDQWV